jgi:hypothetical protein
MKSLHTLRNFSNIFCVNKIVFLTLKVKKINWLDPYLVGILLLATEEGLIIKSMGLNNRIKYTGTVIIAKK